MQQATEPKYSGPNDSCMAVAAAAALRGYRRHVRDIQPSVRRRELAWLLRCLLLECEGRVQLPYSDLPASNVVTAAAMAARYSAHHEGAAKEVHIGNFDADRYYDEQDLGL